MCHLAFDKLPIVLMLLLLFFAFGITFDVLLCLSIGFFVVIIIFFFKECEGTGFNVRFFGRRHVTSSSL